jgi:hypothetical protein
MATGSFEVGDEVLIRGAVTAVWPDGQVTVQLAWAAHKVTMPGDSGNIILADGAPVAKPSGKAKRLV